MNTAAALALQSIPFAILVVATNTANRDVFVVVYTAALGLILSVTLLADGQAPFLPTFGVHEDARR